MTAGLDSTIYGWSTYASLCIFFCRDGQLMSRLRADGSGEGGERKKNIDQLIFRVEIKREVMP
jgi:hypothetical protein